MDPFTAPERPESRGI